MWRRQGVVGKLHNFVNAVLSSHNRRKAFQSIRQEVNEEDDLHTFGTLDLICDGGIRWVSTYLMLLRCIELKSAVKRDMRARRSHSG